MTRPADEIPALDAERARTYVERCWDDEIVPALADYIRIPNKSPMFEPEWRTNGHMEEAVALIEGWLRARAPEGASLEVLRLEGRTPLILMEIPGDVDDTVLLYGHLDKQPEMTGWSEGLGPWTPVLRGDRLYGRGGADDGYAAFASLTAIGALRAQGIPHARCVVLIEACEESGSYDLPAYIEHLADRFGEPSLVVCLDSGCGNYEQLWCTTSLRGIITGDLRVEILTEGVHSGDASGIVPSSFRVARQILSRLEDPDSGAIRAAALCTDIPEERARQAERVAAVLGSAVYDKFPLVEGTQPASDDLPDLVLARTWRPALEITGASGLPSLEDAGNVMRPKTELKLSLRLPPTVDAQRAGAELKALLEESPPYGARVSLSRWEGASGWDAPPLSSWLEESLHDASQTFFGREAVFMGEGGSIPFMGMLGEKFPEAQFLITGVLGPHSNAHGPNEFLHIPTGKRLTAAVARVLRDHRAHR